MARQFKIKWIDAKKEPQCAPDPAYPAGKDVDGSQGAQSCHVELPYPARRCGVYVVRCKKCDCTVVCTTAGRADDPRSIRIPCQFKPN